MARDSRVEAFIKTTEQAVVTGSVMSVFEAMRLFGYINEMEYSELNTAWLRMTRHPSVRSDGAETIELARTPIDPEEILPKEY
jgi:hypothetical protein